MNALLVFSHPDPASFTAAVTQAVRAGFEAAGHAAEVADLAREGFDPRMQLHDLAVYREQAVVADDIVREQRRVDRADALVLVYPVWWWSMPAQLKGWIDRVFINGWAYGYTPEGKARGLLANRPLHLLALGAADADSYHRRGYAEAMARQIDIGIFRFCGLTDARTHLLLDVEGADASVRDAHLRLAHDLGRTILGDQARPGVAGAVAAGAAMP